MTLGRAFKVRIFIAILGAVLMISYQNCGVNYSTNQGDRFSTAAKNLDFMYEAAYDQMAYMSCSEQKDIPNDEDVFFTFRLGAYRSGAGLRLKPFFFDYAKKLNEFQKVALLSDSDINSNTRLQFSIRSTEDVSGGVYVNDGGPNQGTPEIDYSYEFGVLGTDTMSAALIKLPTESYMRHWAGAGVDRDAVLEGTLTFNDSEAVARNLRSFLEKRGLLVLGFTENRDIKLRGPSGATNGEVYGMGASVKFKNPSTSTFFKAQPAFTFGGSVAHGSLPRRVLGTVKEVPIGGSLTQASSGSWSCDPKMIFMIIREQDAVRKNEQGQDVTLCKRLSDDSSEFASTSAEFKAIVRNSLRESDWWIDWTNNCIIPKKFQTGSCYGKHQQTSQPRQVEYDFTQNCSPDIEIYTGATLTTKVCPHFASVCTRRSLD